MNLIKLSQFVSLPFLYILISPFYKLEINKSDDFNKAESPVIFASNHVALFDSFLLRFVLKKRLDLLPVHFMASSRFRSKIINFFWKVRFIPILYKLFGAVVIPLEGDLEEKLSPAISLIKKNKNIYLFPEGEISKKLIKPFKKGAAALAIKTGVPLIPISLRIVEGPFLRKKIIINVGELLMFSESTNYLIATKMIEDKINFLHEFK